MPSRERKLKKEAMDSFTFRGHVSKKRNWIKGDYKGQEFVKYCKECQLEVRVRLNPILNDIEISGEAIAVSCDEVIKRN